MSVDYPKYKYEQILDRLTNAFQDKANDTDAIVTSSVVVATAAGSKTLISIPAQAGEEILISEVDIFASTANTAVEFTLSYSYTVSGTTFAQAKTYLLDPSINKMVFDVQSFRNPIMSVLAGGTFNITVQVLNAGVGGTYGANLKFAIR
jgi:hypothetical protein